MAWFNKRMQYQNKNGETIVVVSTGDFSNMIITQFFKLINNELISTGDVYETDIWCGIARLFCCSNGFRFIGFHQNDINGMIKLAISDYNRRTG